MLEPLGEFLAILTLPLPHHGGVNGAGRPLLAFGGEFGEEPVGDLLGGQRGDGHPAIGAVRLAQPREQQPVVIVQLRDGADRGAGVPVDRLLIDGNGGAEPLHMLHPRLFHVPQELPRVGRQRFQEPALPFLVQRIEGQRGFSGAAHPGEHGERVAGQSDVNGLEIVLAGADDDDVFRAGRAGHHDRVRKAFIPEKSQRAPGGDPRQGERESTTENGRGEAGPGRSLRDGLRAQGCAGWVKKSGPGAPQPRAGLGMYRGEKMVGKGRVFVVRVEEITNDRRDLSQRRWRSS